MIKRFLPVLLTLLLALAFSFTAMADATITLTPESILVNGTGVSVAGQQITVNAGGLYELTGTHPDVCIDVQADGSDVVLLMNDVSLHRENGEAIIIEKGQPVVIELAEGTNNVLSAAADNPDQQLGVIRSKGTLTLTGHGTLRINGRKLTGIHTSKTLTINDCTLLINAEHHGLRAKKGITVNSATVQIVCDGKALYAGDSDEGIRADIEAEDATFSLSSGSDGLQATGEATLSGCTLVQVSGKNGIQADEAVILENTMLLILSGKKAVNSPSQLALDTQECDIGYGSSLVAEMNGVSLECTAPDDLDHLTRSSEELPGCSITVNGLQLY